MHDHNPGTPEGRARVLSDPEPPDSLPPDSIDSLPPELEPAPDETRFATTRRGLMTWFVLLATAGVGGLLLGQDELAALAALAGLYVAAQAADLDAQWALLADMVAWVVPAAGVAVFLTLAFMLDQSKATGQWTTALTGGCIAAAIASGLTLARPFANALAAVMFQGQPPSRTLRLSARLVFILLAFAVPGWFALRSMFDTFMGQLDSLIESSSLGTGLIGYVILALASVGWMLRRNWHETLERLGIRRVTPTHLLVIALSVLGLYALNGAADWVQRTYFHPLWLEDQRVSEAIAGKLTVMGAIMLGLSAGIGEEITMRGAVQPKLGLVLTALVFATLHVQYTWFGVGMIFLFGLLLGLLRSRTNTTVAMAVHALYDMAAVFSIIQAK